ncbi:hypothetical protein MKW94_022972 [Papaver nudicaule]|uniref:Protein kinase domain-containing protein n=1 Tax=Papaver nudicaule TaxID=74823 RepID=A0AA41S757_PAPNU|nr:hypothetical protein [Papaver nudicaule]
MDVLMDWKSMGSLYASLMFMKTALRDIIPPELYKAARSIFFYFFSNLQTKIVTIHIQEFIGRYDNDIFKSIQRYLSSKCFTSSQYLTLSKMKNSKNHTYTMIPNQSIVDVFEGIKFTWSFRTEDSDDSGGSKGKSTNYFELCFDEKHKEFVNSSYLTRIAEEAKLIKSKNKGKKLYTNQSGDRWTMISQFSHPSTFDTIALDPVLKQDIQDDLQKFVSRKEFYTRVGKAWKRGYLLYGPPGTGKTSLIAAIANYLEFDIYDLELTSVRNNQDLRELLISTSSKSIIVVEDIDCSLDLENRESKNKPRLGDTESDTDKNTSTPKTGVSSVSLSGLLNFVDGLWSPCAGERLIIFTTNHKEKLDPALLRAGRMDKHILLSYCNIESLKVLTRNYLRIEEHELMSEAEELLSLVQITAADVAECLMSYDENPDMGMRNLVAEMHKRLLSQKNLQQQGNNEETKQNIEKMKGTDGNDKRITQMTNIIFFRPVYKDEEIVVEDEEVGEPDPVSIVSRINRFAGCSSLDDDETEVTDEEDCINLNGASQANTNFDAPFEAEVNVTLDAPFGMVQEAAPVWPSWLSPIPDDAIKGWSPRLSSSFEILHEIGQDSRCKIFKGRDIMTGKIVALKKLKLYTWEPEYVEEMAQEILVLRRLNSHPNVVKLEGLVLIHEEPLSLYLVFEYVEHTFADLITTHKDKFTEPQVKCYMHQLLLGLEYCHSRGVVHGNINGFNLLISNKGVLKIAGFGTAASIGCPTHRQSGMLGETVPLLYQAPEFRFGNPAYSTVGADLWGVGCILAELLAPKPIVLRLQEERRYPHKRGRRNIFEDFPPSSLKLAKTLLAYNPAQRQTAFAALTDEFFTTSPSAVSSKEGSTSR